MSVVCMERWPLYIGDLFQASACGGAWEHVRFRPAAAERDAGALEPLDTQHRPPC